MKKDFLLLFFAFVCWGGMLSPLQAETLTIGSGTGWNYKTAPINAYNNHSYTQTIYTREEVSALAGKKITAISYTFKNTNTSKQFNFPIKVWIGTTDKTYFSSSSQWVSVDDLNLCYEGIFNPTGTEEQLVTWNFTLPYIYEGDKNLVIAVLDTERTLWSMDALWKTGSTTPNSTVIYTSVNGMIDPASPGSGTATVDRPNTVFTYEDVPDVPVLTVGSDALNFSYIKAATTETKTVALRNTGKAPLTVTSIDGLAAPFSSPVRLPFTLQYMESAEISMVYAPTAAGEHTSTVSINSNGGNATLILSGSAYPATALFEHFDGGVATPKGWRHVKNELSTSYEVKSPGGVDGSSYIQVKINYGDTLVSPKVGGKVTFYAKYHSDSYNNYESVLKVFTSADCKNWTEAASLGGELQNNWKEFEITGIPENTYVGFYMYKASLDEFFAEYAVVPQNDLLVNSFDLAANFNEQSYTGISIMLYNWGYVDIPAGAYRIEVRDQSTDRLLKNIENTPALPVADTAYYVKDSLYIILDEKVKTPMQIYVKAIYDADEDMSNNRTAPKQSNVVPLIGDLQIAMTSRVVTTGKPIDFGIIAGPDAVATREFKFSNMGIAPVTVSGANVPPPFTSSLTFPVTVPAKSDYAFTVSMQGNEGSYERDIVFTHNGLGETTIFVKGVIAPAGYMLESFLSADEFPPAFWLRTGAKEDRKGWERDVFTSYLGNTQEEYAGEKACAAQLQDIADTLITPKVLIKDGEQLSFWLRKRFNNTSSLVLLYSRDKENWQEAVALDGDATDENLKIDNTFRKYEISFPETGDFYIGFAGVNVQLDMIRGYEILYAEHDMAVHSLNGPAEGVVNYTNTYDVKFRNYGKTKETAYRIRLMADGTELMSMEGSEILTLESRQLSFAWTPRESGIYNVYAEIVLDGEENPADNLSDTITVTVAPETAERTIRIGNTDNVTSSYPMKAMWYYSVYESIYYADELTGFQPGTEVRKLGLPYFASNDYKAATRIYMTVTGQQDLSQPIQASAMTKVYDSPEYTVTGNEDMSRTQPGVMEFVLDEPFVYTGGNLVVMIETNSTAYQTVNFFENASDEVRTRGYCSDDKNVPPANTVSLDLTKETGVTNNYPTMIFSSYTEPAVITGTVMKDEKEGPDTTVPDAGIVLKNGIAEYRGTTDGAGNFSITVYQTAREYEVIVSAAGCISDTLTVDVNRPAIDMGTIVLRDANDVGARETKGGVLFCYVDRTGMLNISADGEILYVGVISAGGTLCRVAEPLRQEARIDLSGYEKGIYLIEIRTVRESRLVKVVR